MEPGLWYFLRQVYENDIISNNNISNNYCGIRVGGISNNITIASNIVSYNGAGISLEFSPDSKIINNELQSNEIGIAVVGSSNCTLMNNTASYNGHGIYIGGSSNCTLTNNIASNNYLNGVYLVHSSNNTLANNIFNSNWYWYGIYLESSNTNLIYNNYFYNTNNVYDDGNNIWNITQTPGTNIVDGSWLGGNYWSDYAGVDTDGDGIGDTLTPYNCSGNISSGGDWLPLVMAEEEPYTNIDVGVTSNITLADPEDIAAYLPPEYDGVNITNAVVLNVNVTDNTNSTTDDAYTDITINVGDLNIATCKVFKSGVGFLPEVPDVSTLPTVKPPGEPAFSRTVANDTVTVRLYVGDPLLALLPPAEPLVGEWHFDEGLGTVAHDSSGLGNDGIIYGATWTEGVSGSAMLFNGTSGFIEVPDADSLKPAQLSISAWVKPSVAQNEIELLQPIITKNNRDAWYYADGYDLYYSTSHISLSLAYGSNWRRGGGVPATLPPNEWSHVVATYDQQNISFYVDGNFIGSVPYTYPIYYGSGNVWIGKWYQTRSGTTLLKGNYYFNGTLDEIVIYSRALAPQEIQAIYKAHAPPAEPPIFDTGEGTYPSISGTFTGTIVPSRNLTVSTLYTYPCEGTGGHTKSIELYENTTLIASGVWSGYQGDWHNITLSSEVTLLKDHEYRYVIETGSYPQIIHASGKAVTGGTITCTEFVDVNGVVHEDWIPTTRLE